MDKPKESESSDSKCKDGRRVIRLQNTSLYIFGPNNSLRRTLATVISSNYFEETVMCLIALSSMLLMIDTP
jgi:hypothetical protein